MVKNIKNSGSGSSKNIRNDDSLKLSVLKVTDATITNATITNLTNTELQTATANISTNTASISTNTASISTNASNIATNTASISTNASNIATNTASISTNTASISTNASNITNLENNKQDLITDDTNLEINRLDINESIRFQFNDSTDEKTKIERGDANGKLKFTGNNVFFHDDTDAETFAIKNNGDLNCFNNSIDNVLDIDLNGTSLNFQLTNKQDTLTAGNGITISEGLGTSISVNESELTTKQDTLGAGDDITIGNLTIDKPGATNVTFNMKNSTSGDLFRFVYNTDSNFVAIQISDDGVSSASTLIRITSTDIRFRVDFDLYDNNILNGGSASFSSITLNGSDVETDITTNTASISTNASNIATNTASISTKADDFNINSNGLLMDSGAFPLRELRLLYSSNYFNINGSNELSLNKNIVEVKTTNFNLSSSGNWGSTTATYPYISGWGSISTLSGSNFLSNASNGVFSVSSNGLYKIVLNVAGENVSINNRVVLGVYFSIDDKDSSFRSVPGEFLLEYLRDDNFGVGGSGEITFYKNLTTSNTIRFKSRIAIGTDNRNYNDETDDANLNLYTSLIIDKIS